MKKLKPIIFPILVFAIIGTGLAFKPRGLDQGTVYCNSSCTLRKDFRISDPPGTTTDPCNNGPSKEYIRFYSNCSPIF